MDMTPKATLDRRSFLGAAGAVAVGAAVAGPSSVFAQDEASHADAAAPSDEPVITRQIRRTGQSVTALGLRTFMTFDLLPGGSRETLREVFRRYAAGGGGVVDTSPLYGSAELSVGAFLSEIPEAQDMFLANKIWSTGEFLGDTSHAQASFEQSRLRTWRSSIDLLQCHSITNGPVILPLLQAWKNEGLIGHVGVTHHETRFQSELADIVESGAVDVVQTNYSILSRGAEERLLPAAANAGVGVFVNMPLEKARLTHLVAGQPLPDFAAEFGATTWTQFFLKWVIANPAVTCVLCGTSNPDHVAENLGAMRGDLPDAAMRQRMVEHMQTIPGFESLAETPWYPGKEGQYQGLIGQAQAEARERLAG